MPRLSFPTLILLFAVTACELPREEPAEVDYPVDREAGEMPIDFAGAGEAALVVPVYINGEGPYNFVLDTGATLTCIEREIAERLELPQRRVGAVGAGAEGAGRVEIVQVDSLRLGGASAADLDACILDLAHTRAIGVAIDGLLGLNFLRAFRVTLDFGSNVMTLEEPR